MSNDNMGWRGKAVLHSDGRKGTITGEYVGHCHIGLTLTVTDTGATENIQLNSDGRDSGATDWLWRHTEEGVVPEVWSLLGDHNHPEQK